jgi:hypothetical protein
MNVNNFHRLKLHSQTEMVTIRTFGRIIQTPERTVRDLVARRIIPFVKIKRFIRIPLAAALDALKKYEHKAISI